MPECASIAADRSVRFRIDSGATLMTNARPGGDSALPCRPVAEDRTVGAPEEQPDGNGSSPM
jgi:hypothetical protein